MLTLIGVGNRYCGDDAIGPELIDALRAEAAEDLELIDAGSDALSVLELLEGRDQVMLLDCCQMGRKPGEVVVFEAKDASFIISNDPFSLHGLGLAETLQMAESLQILPKDLKIVGIEPESVELNSPISQPVRKALKRVLEKIQKERRTHNAGCDASID